jgi:hypothetical protein
MRPSPDIGDLYFAKALRINLPGITSRQPPMTGSNIIATALWFRRVFGGAQEQTVFSFIEIGPGNGI